MLTQTSDNTTESILCLVLKWISLDDSEESKDFEMILKKAESKEETIFELDWQSYKAKIEASRTVSEISTSLR